MVMRVTQSRSRLSSPLRRTRAPPHRSRFTLSWGRRSPITGPAGRWCRRCAGPQFRSRRDAEALGMKLVDTLRRHSRHRERDIPSLRKFDWDTFNVNFFVFAPPNARGFPRRSHEFYLPRNDPAFRSCRVSQFRTDRIASCSPVQKLWFRSRAQFSLFCSHCSQIAGPLFSIASTQTSPLPGQVMRPRARPGALRANSRGVALRGALAGSLRPRRDCDVFRLALRCSSVLHFNSMVWLTVRLPRCRMSAAVYAGTRGVLNVARSKRYGDDLTRARPRSQRPAPRVRWSKATRLLE